MTLPEKIARRAMWALALPALAAWLCSGIYIVKTDEIGIIRLFGKVATTTIEGKSVPHIIPPGLHYRLPYPFTRVNRVRPTEMKTATVGFEPMDQFLGRAGDPRRSEFLTGDQNIIQLRMTVQYAVDDPAAYLFGPMNPDAALKAEAESCLAAAVASMGVDGLIGEGRVKAGEQVRAELGRQIAMHNLGVRVSAVSLQAPTPPQEVAEAFNDVQSAKAERSRRALEAEADRNGIVTRAVGEADKLRREAEAYGERRVAEARGEAGRFADLLTRYQQAKSVTRLRLYLEAMEEILPQMRKVFVDSDKEGAPIDLGVFGTTPP